MNRSSVVKRFLQLPKHHHHLRPHTDDVLWDRRMLFKSGGIGLGAFLLAAVRSREQGSVTSAAADASPLPGFDEFAETVSVFVDNDYWLVESNGMPSHNMMVGITSWQQQVPVSQPYLGANAWKIPRTPVLADVPVSARTGLFRGAIAIAVNGVPIFNALNNRGDDAFLAGELDEWGGHAGRADDYHYHVAPLHLQSLVGISSR